MIAKQTSRNIPKTHIDMTLSQSKEYIKSEKTLMESLLK